MTTDQGDRIRARGGDVVFLCGPSAGPWRELERNATPREKFWDALLENTDAGGVHFEDHTALGELETPEWSHLSASALATRAPVTAVQLEVGDPSNDEELQ